MSKSEVIMIPVDKINDVRLPLVHFSNWSKKRLKKSIVKEGIRNPLTVIQMTDGRYHVEHGKHRFYVAKKLGVKEIPCIVSKRYRRF
jgi:ParB-like chromosome segregation protein Spo0J